MKKMKLLIPTLLAVCILAAQTPSGLLTGPVSYVSPLTSGNVFGNNTVWTVANTATMPTVPPDASNSSACSASGIGPNGTTIPNCYILKYVVGYEYGNLVASDGTGDCYAWNVQQLTTDGRGFPPVPPCQNSFVGNGSGEYGALYCSNPGSTDINGFYNLNCQATWDGTASNANGPIQTVYTINVNIRHHAVIVWIPQRFRSAAHWEKWQQIDSMTVGVTPQPSS